VASIVPRFRRFDADVRLVDASLRRIFDEARDYASTPASYRDLGRRKSPCSHRAKAITAAVMSCERRVVFYQTPLQHPVSRRWAGH
jgi:hypothetical protein